MGDPVETGASPVRRRRRYDADFKREVVNETLAPGASVARIAREYGLNANQLFNWRRKQPWGGVISLVALDTERQSAVSLPSQAGNAGS